MTFTLGVDIGHTNVKCTVVESPSGRIIASAQREYPNYFPRPGWVEVEAADWWNSFIQVLGEVFDSSGVPLDACRAIGITSFSCSPVCLDGAGNVLRRVPTYADSRSEPQLSRFRDRAHEILERSGSPLGSWSFLPKLWWMHDEEPAVFAKVKTVLEPGPYVVWRLTGEAVADVHSATMNYGFDFRGEEWDRDFVRSTGVAPDVLPRLTRPLEVAGTISATAAETTGLREGTPVVACGDDAVTTALSVGVRLPGTAFYQAGSGSNLGILTAEKIAHPGFIALLHAEPGVAMLVGLMGACGSALKWFRNEAGAVEEEAARLLAHRLSAYDLLSAEAATAPDGANGVIFFPYLHGRMSPVWHSHVRGAFLGLTAQTSRQDQVRAIMEGTAMELAGLLDLASQLGVEVDEIVAGGGPTQSDVWCQIFADVTGRRFVAAQSVQAASFGAALMAASACFDEPLHLLLDRSVRPGRKFEPREGAFEEYQTRREAHDELYPHLARFYERVTAGGGESP